MGSPHAVFHKNKSLKTNCKSHAVLFRFLYNNLVDSYIYEYILLKIIKQKERKSNLLFKKLKRLLNKVIPKRLYSYTFYVLSSSCSTVGTVYGSVCRIYNKRSYNRFNFAFFCPSEDERYLDTDRNSPGGKHPAKLSEGPQLSSTGASSQVLRVKHSLTHTHRK